MRSRRHWGGASLGLKLAAAAGLVFLHLPVWVIVLYAFTTEDRTYQFPPPGLTLHWFEVAFAREDIWQAMRLSLLVASAATLLAIVLGTLAAFAMARRSFAGKESITLLFVLPIALPGIITGLALLAGIRAVGFEPSFWTIVAGHATFCLVIVYNNVVARPRGLAPLEAAPAPRRFAGGLAAILTLAIAVALATGATSTAWVLEALLAIAVVAVVFGRTCAAADLYNALRRWSSRGRTAAVQHR